MTYDFVNFFILYLYLSLNKLISLNRVLHVDDDTGNCRLLISHARRWAEAVQGVLGQKKIQRIDPMLLKEIFQTPFSNNNNEKKSR